MQIETLAVHAGHAVDPSTGAVTPPIHLSTNFERAVDGNYPQGYIYTRTCNPNRAALEQCLCALEGGEAAVAFASGAAATMSVFQALAPTDHVIAPQDVYHGTRQLLRDVFVPWGLEVTFVDMTDILQVQQAIRPNTKLIWVETPSNPLLKITDIAQLCHLAHQVGAVCVCDNTWATPILQRPFAHGADLVVHSTTKYLSGHSDVLGGVAIAKIADNFYRKIRQIQTTGGAVPSPFDCWLLLRGIRTLPYRMRAHSENAQKVALFLKSHEQVESVYYPGLKQDPGHEMARGQMTLFGGMVAFQVKGNQDRAMAIAANVSLFTRATSLGGTESLIEHRASIEGRGTQTPDNLLRMSIGLEHADDLIKDLENAISRSF